MAAPIQCLLRFRKCVNSHCLLKQPVLREQVCVVLSRLKTDWNKPPSYDNTTYNSVEVGLSPDGSTVVCWHPEQQFPYEHTLPLPRKDPSTFESDSVLKVQHLRDEEFRHRPDGPTDSELSEMFRTSKHTWYPRPQRKYIKPKQPKDRDSL